MIKTAFLILFIGFIPSFAPASQSEGYLTLIDYAFAFGGFCFGCMIWELSDGQPEADH